MLEHDTQSTLALTIPLSLYTFSLSHFSEKIRWALEESRVPFTEVAWTPVFHFPRALRSGGVTVPIVEHDGKRVRDSTRILHWLIDRYQPTHLLPEDLSSFWAIEERFDEIGDHVTRYAYSESLTNARVVVPLWTIDASPREGRFIRRQYPVIRWVFARRLRLNARNVAHSRSIIESGLTWLEARVSATKPYLVGERFTYADITAAALLAPLACPDEHPVYSTHCYRDCVDSVTRDWRDRPAFDWVRTIYRLHRSRSPRAAYIASRLAR